MEKTNMPVPANELERLLELAELDVDYSEHKAGLHNLAKLAAVVTGTRISLVNLIDSLTQWTISNYGLDIDQAMREDSVCQYTIMEDEFLEIGDLSADERFRQRDFVSGEQAIRYYYGVPLKTSAGVAIGALCVLDRDAKKLGPDQVEILKIIADEIVNRLRSYKMVEDLKKQLVEARLSEKKLAHDIRVPIGGIVGLAQIISDQGTKNNMDEVLEYMTLIAKSGTSVLDMAEETMGTNVGPSRKIARKKQGDNDFNLVVFRQKIITLYGPLARQKHIELYVNTSPLTENIALNGSKLLQIAGNLISNSIKFTPSYGRVNVDLRLIIDPSNPLLHMIVKDNGMGMDKQALQIAFSGTGSSTQGTAGERGQGFGLALVRHLVDSLKGTMMVKSEPGQGTHFEVSVPQNVYGG